MNRCMNIEPYNIYVSLTASLIESVYESVEKEHCVTNLWHVQNTEAVNISIHLDVSSGPNIVRYRSYVFKCNANCMLLHVIKFVRAFDYMTIKIGKRLVTHNG